MGTVIVVISQFFWKLPGEFVSFEVVLWFLLAVPIVVVLLTRGAFLNFVFKLVKYFGKKDIRNLGKFNLSSHWFFSLYIVFSKKFLFYGIALFVIAKLVLLELNLSLLPVFIGIASLSWIAGYIAFFAPGGLGVMEGTLAVFLAPYMTLPAASLAAVGFRLFLLLSEAVFLGIAYIFLRVDNIKKR